MNALAQQYSMLRGSFAQGPIRILLVEDSPGDVFLLEHMLKGEAPDDTFDITNVQRLADAFKMLDSDIFDIILLDLNLLDMDGVACVSALQAESPDTPVIVYSGMDSDKLRDEALKCGACCYLVKGKENANSLHTAIRRILKHGA